MKNHCLSVLLNEGIIAEIYKLGEKFFDEILLGSLSMRKKLLDF